MKCPGQDSRYWSGEDVFEADCPNCGHSVEFFKDDSQQKCRECGHRMLNPKMDFGCASYCPHAEQCLGSMPPELIAKQGDLFKDRVGLAMRKYFAEDTKHIQHALDVAEHAEVIGKAQEDCDMMVIMAAALLHEIGLKNALKKYNSASAKYLHIEGPPLADEILTDLKAPRELIDEVCDIISHYQWPGDEETVNFKVLHDANLIVNTAQLYQIEPHGKTDLDQLAATSFLTVAGAAHGVKILKKFIQ